ncbi:hypothetical protein SJY04_14055 [Aeromonas dhakensis]|uniref:hypothetical protein n=1 Tax=Aeromonas dhakensis TaxID=196024 RepID=UPI0029D44EEA|nr:hypothetical protein [Aeromonas dhakensis]MDX7742250.1 hypothetical protein [Aeromonas dhakensis]
MNNNETNSVQNGNISSLENPKRITCGLIMPISAIGKCDEKHWWEVKEILTDTLNGTEFDLKLVSDEDEANVIHNRIVTNVYSSDIVVCDVSANNPNVMFELGMRLAFDKATVIIKDDKTKFSFDISPFNHIIYPRDLNMIGMKRFQRELLSALKATHEASKVQGYSAFLKHFSITEVRSINEKKVSPDKYIIDKLNELSETISDISRDKRLTRDGGVSYFDFSGLIEYIRGGGVIHLPQDNMSDLLLSNDINTFLEGNDIVSFLKSNKIRLQDVPDRDVVELFNTYFKISKEIHEYNPQHKLEPERIVVNFMSRLKKFLD